MKRMCYALLAAAMVWTMAACGRNNGKDDETQSPSMVETESGGETEVSQASEAAVPGESPAQALLAKFQELMESGETASAEEMANKLVSQEWIPFGGMALAVEPGYLAGFTEEIDGFAEGATFGPVISSIPFVGYIFQLEEGADVGTFVQNLKDTADLRWNICTEADEILCEAIDNTVLFVMSPARFD